ncbi:cation:proton antiporter [Candidatus Aerophobetes bacterium]|nr:cation:proton antiporter [Candidatus Aerophobetes bacterium]
MNILLIIGIAAFTGFIAGKLFNQLKIPAVVGWTAMGVVMGSSVAGVFSQEMLSRSEIIFELALGFIGFSIGEELVLPKLRRLGKPIVIMTIFGSIVPFFIVAPVVFAITGNIHLSLILGAISSATAPAATVMVIEEVRARGDLTTTILGIVALDDAVCLILYAFAASIAKIFIAPGAHFSFFLAIIQPMQEIFGAILLGCGMGALLSLSSRWVKSSTDFFVIVVAAILLNIGLSTLFGFSELLANMSLGATIANLSPRPLRRISNIWRNSTPFLYIIFFCLSGAYLNAKLVFEIGLLGLAYTGARMAGKFLGAYFGAKISDAPKVIQKFAGLSLFPQAGVALALAMMAKKDFSPYGAEGAALANIIINLLLFTIIITEIVGPYLTRWSLIKSGEAQRGT